MKDAKYSKMFYSHKSEDKLTRAEVIKYTIAFLAFVLMTGINF